MQFGPGYLIMGWDDINICGADKGEVPVGQLPQDTFMLQLVSRSLPSCIYYEQIARPKAIHDRVIAKYLELPSR